MVQVMKEEVLGRAGYLQFSQHAEDLLGKIVATEQFLQDQRKVIESKSEPKDVLSRHMVFIVYLY